MKVKKAFAQNQAACPEQKYELSVSIGFSGCADHNACVSDILNAADEKLYEGKRV